MKFLIGGGGTAGHLVPGIALYKELKKHQYQLYYILSDRDKSYDISQILDEHERSFVTLTGISRKLSLNTFKQIWSIFNAWRLIFKEIKKFNPDIMVITGGYVSNIVALSAFVMRKPLYILEQNSVAGITNRFWSKYAKKIFSTFPNPKFIPVHKDIFTGNPLLYTSQLSIQESKSILGLENNNKPVLGISGGSQGAKKINDLILQILPELIEKGYQIIWSLGTKEFERFSQEKQLESLNQYDNNVKVYRFITRMDAFWGASSLVLSRSGAGTVSESQLFKTPCLFIPIYQSPDDHQLFNAKYLYDQKCASILEESILTKELLLHTIITMLENISTYQNFPDIGTPPVEIIVNNILNN